MASPIFYPKSPTDMGGGAPAKAGADLSALGFVSVDLSSGWTLTDPDGLVDTVSHSGGVNTVTMNALGTGNLHYSWANATDMRAPRWHKELKIADADGAEQFVLDDRVVHAHAAFVKNAHDGLLLTELLGQGLA